MIVERDGKFCLVGKSSGETLGCHDTREGAEAQERAILAYRGDFDDVGDANSVMRYDRGRVGQSRVDEETGFLHAPLSVTRAGIFLYRDGRGNVRRELRHPDEVGDPASLATLRNVTITDGHPPGGFVNSQNARDLGVGSTGTQVEFTPDQHVDTDATIRVKETIDKVLRRDAVEVSGGYRAVVIKEPGEWNGQRYDARQTRIRYNHVAIVPRGRAGHSARIHLDAADAAEIDETETIKRGPIMTKIKIDGVEFEVSEAAAIAVTAVLDQRDALKTKAETERARADQAEKDRDKAIQERKDAEQATPPIHEAVEKRMRLMEDVATVVKMDDEAKAHVAKLDDDKVRAFVVKHACPEVRVDDESADYIRARFDGLVASAKRYDSTASAGAALLSASRTRTDDDGIDELNKRIDDAMSKDDNRWRGATA